jgi:GH25 family lysozyme M1 (1,4-beta-N-acetylmuramidase)
MIHGIGDLNDYFVKPTDDFRVAKTRGLEWATIRATTTGAWVGGKPSLRADKTFASCSERCEDNGIKRVAYCWFDPRVKLVPAKDQAEFFVAMTLYWEGGSIPMIDLEDTSTILAFPGIGEHIHEWLSIVEAETGKKPWLYMNKGYLDKYLFPREPWLIEYPLYLANWGVNAPAIALPWGANGWTAWQYTSTAPGEYFGFGKKPLCLSVMK